jgi:rhodanese-related sulfurtransferase
MKVFLHISMIAWLVSIGLSACSAQTEVGQKSGDQVTPLLDDEQWQLVDVRTPAEIDRGYLKGTDFFINFNSYDFEDKVESLDASQPVLLICRSGSRSQRAANLLVEKGFEAVYNLEGGLMRWRDPKYIIKK